MDAPPPPRPRVPRRPPPTFSELVSIRDVRECILLHVATPDCGRLRASRALRTLVGQWLAICSGPTAADVLAGCQVPVLRRLVAVAPDGGAVRISAGTYVLGGKTLEMTNPDLSLVGEPGVVLSNEGGAPGDDEDGATAQTGFSLTVSPRVSLYTGAKTESKVSISDVKTVRGWGLDVRQGCSVDVERCDFTGGMNIQAGGSAVLRDCCCRDSVGQGVTVTGSLHMTRCTVTGSGGDGILVMGGSAVLRECTVTHSNDNGVCAYSGGQVTIVGEITTSDNATSDLAEQGVKGRFSTHHRDVVFGTREQGQIKGVPRDRVVVVPPG